MKGWLRMATLGSLVWVLGSAVILLVEYLRMERPGLQSGRPKTEVFLLATVVRPMHVRHPALGVIEFPESMDKTEIERVVLEALPRNYDGPRVRTDIEWNVPATDDSSYYSVRFSPSRFARWGIAPAVATWIVFAAIAWGVRWVRRGFKKEPDRVA